MTNTTTLSWYFVKVKQRKLPTLSYRHGMVNCIYKSCNKFTLGTLYTLTIVQYSTGCPQVYSTGCWDTLDWIWIESSLTPLPAQYRSFWGWSSQPITELRPIQRQPSRLQLGKAKQAKVNIGNSTRSRLSHCRGTHEHQAASHIPALSLPSRSQYSAKPSDQHIGKADQITAQHQTDSYQ